MGTPIYVVCQRRVAAGQQTPSLPPEVTELYKLEEYLELPPAAWEMDYPSDLEKYQESNEYLPLLPAGKGAMKPASAGQPTSDSTAQGANQSDNQAGAGFSSDVEPELAGFSSSG